MLSRFYTVLIVLIGLAGLQQRAVAEIVRDAEAAKLAAQAPPLQLVGKKGRIITLPNLIKGERIPVEPGEKPLSWNLGQTGIIGCKNGGDRGSQVRVLNVMEGTPAYGKVLPGDVILGVGGQDYELDGQIGLLTGTAIIKAEEPASKGKLVLHIWRDLNWHNRFGEQNMYSLDLEKAFADAEGDETLYDWTAEDDKGDVLMDEAYKKWPLQPEEHNITLTLKTIGTYSDTSPFDCKVADTIRGNALKVIAKNMSDPKSRKGSWPSVLALVASGKPEYVALAEKWVGRQRLETDINKHFEQGDGGDPGGKTSWSTGFNHLEMAIYAEATGDKRVLPEIRRRAIYTAMGQNGGGSWGHGFSYRKSNGGLLHRNNPGYGAMNNAGTRCFFFLTLAQKLGIKHPEIDMAIKRSERYFRTFVDKGVIPYGYHAPWPGDDSNGKNYGATYAFYTLGKKYEAKFFSMCSAHASFTRRGGHGSPTLWYYSPLSQNISGPKAIQATHRNMRWFFTLARRHDGSFVFQGAQSPGIGGKGMRDATATHALYYSYPLKQTIITGKDADPDFFMTDDEYEDLIVSGSTPRFPGDKSQIHDPYLLKKAGKTIYERDTDDLIRMLDSWHTVFRRGLAGELGKRYKAGETDIPKKLVPMLTHSEARMRGGACWALSECGPDAILANLSHVVPLLQDEREFVRMQAIRTIGMGTQPGDANREEAVLSAIVNDVDDRTMDNGNVGSWGRDVILKSLSHKKGEPEPPRSKLLSTPFDAGYDYDLVRSAMERIVTLDPGGRVPGGWTKETLIDLAGPVLFSAEELQMNDSMFAGARKTQAQALLRKHGYREGYESDAANLRKHKGLDRDLRSWVGFKDAYITPSRVLQNPAYYAPFLSDFNQLLRDKPNYIFMEKKGEARVYTSLHLLIEVIEKNSDAPRLPTIRDDVGKIFRKRLAAAGDTRAKLAFCRKELADPERKNTFLKIHAMTALEEMLGPDALPDIAPLIGHTEFRLDEHARALAVSFVKQGKGSELISLFGVAAERDTGIFDNVNAAMMLQVLADAGHKPALETMRGALKDKDSKVRRQAIQALFQLGGDAELKGLFKVLIASRDKDELAGCEDALLSRIDDSAYVARCGKAARGLLPKVTPSARNVLAYVIGQFGGAENLTAIKQAVIEHKGSRDLKNMAVALAFSPDRAANQVITELLDGEDDVILAVASVSIYRMVGPNGMKDSSNEQRLDLAEVVLGKVYDQGLITFLGKVHSARTVKLLFDIMSDGDKGRRLASVNRRGRSANGEMTTSASVKSIISCAEEIKKPGKKDTQILVDVLTQVVEYIEVNHLRDGVNSETDATAYTTWRTLQARAGQLMLAHNKVKKKAIATFDDEDLDI